MWVLGYNGLKYTGFKTLGSWCLGLLDMRRGWIWIVRQQLNRKWKLRPRLWEKVKRDGSRMDWAEIKVGHHRHAHSFPILQSCNCVALPGWMSFTTQRAGTWLQYIDFLFTCQASKSTNAYWHFYWHGIFKVESIVSIVHHGSTDVI